MATCCDMRGMLSFLILHLMSKKPLSGQEIRKELHLRKGTRPSAGTIYPVLKSLSKSGLIREVESAGKTRRYALTATGKRELKVATKKFCRTFHDVDIAPRTT